MTVDEKPENSDVLKNAWMIRPCQFYNDEYKDCRSIRGRLHQEFIFGETINCSQWKKDYDNCRKWKNDNNEQAAQEIINSETVRRVQRLKAHYGNNVWEKRDGPPEDWNKPLPEEMQKKYENTYLNIKAREAEQGISSSPDATGFCTIM